MKYIFISTNSNQLEFLQRFFKIHYIVMLVGWIIEILTQIITYNEKALFVQDVHRCTKMYLQRYIAS